MIEILIVEDHPDVCEALVQAFANTPDLKVTGVATNHAEALQLIEASRPDILLADLGLPRGGDGVTLIRRASRLWGRPCNSAVLTAHRNEANLMDAVRAGAVGYIDKSTDPATWVDSVRELAQGRSPLNAALARIFRHVFQHPACAHCLQAHPTVPGFLQQIANGYRFDELQPVLGMDEYEAGRMARQLYACLHQPHTTLTPREQELITLLGQKYDLAQCAVEMGISAHTIKTHSQNLYAKLGSSDKTAAVLEARRQGIIA